MNILQIICYEFKLIFKKKNKIVTNVIVGRLKVSLNLSLGIGIYVD